jgi:hypothetical protein
MTHQEIRYDITNGPSKFDLMVALFKKNEMVQFSIKSPAVFRDTKVVEIIINGIACEDGSRESWLIEGMYAEPTYPNHLRRFEGYYNSRTRIGWLKNVPLQKVG